MPANFSRYFVEAPGNTILADHWNGEFNNILNNFDPDGMDDASANLAAMQSTVDPGELATESLATSLRGEIQRLRWAIQEAKYGSNTTPKWYESPSATNTRPSVFLDNAATDGGALYFNAGTTSFLKSSADGLTLSSGGFTTIDFSNATAVFAPSPGLTTNLSIVRATTTNAGDSIKITSASGTALSSTNVGLISLPGITAGTTTVFSVTADVTILLTGAHWNIDTKGDVTGALLRILAINDNGSLKWGVAYLGGRHTILTTDSSATPSSISAAKDVLCNSAVASASNTCREVGFVRADFDDTGGAAENLWAIQTGVNDVVWGQSADGLWQPWPVTFAGFSANPSITTARWCQVGRTCQLTLALGAGTSNATTKTITIPFAGRVVSESSLPVTVDTLGSTTGLAVLTTAGNTFLDLYRTAGSGPWTNSGSSRFAVDSRLEVGPAASFID